MVSSVMVEISNDFKTHLRYCELLLNLINPFISCFIHLEIIPEDINVSILEKKNLLIIKKRLKYLIFLYFNFDV
jgi:hypothetical protein